MALPFKGQLPQTPASHHCCFKKALCGAFRYSAEPAEPAIERERAGTATVGNMRLLPNIPRKDRASIATPAIVAVGHPPCPQNKSLCAKHSCHAFVLTYPAHHLCHSPYLPLACGRVGISRDMSVSSCQIISKPSRRRRRADVGRGRERWRDPHAIISLEGTGLLAGRLAGQGDSAHRAKLESSWKASRRS